MERKERGQGLVGKGRKDLEGRFGRRERSTMGKG